MPMPERDLRKGSAEVLILALLEERDRHGYEIAKLIDQRSDGALKFHVASLYPTLYRRAPRPDPGQVGRARRDAATPLLPPHPAPARRCWAASGAAGTRSSPRSIASRG